MPILTLNSPRIHHDFNEVQIRGSYEPGDIIKVRAGGMSINAEILKKVDDSWYIGVDLDNYSSEDIKAWRSNYRKNPRSNSTKEARELARDIASHVDEINNNINDENFSDAAFEAELIISAAEKLRDYMYALE